MPTRRIAQFQVSSVALGCMNLSHGYGPACSAQQAKDVLHAALDAGVTLFDTAALYGYGANEALVGPLLKPHRSRIVLASKGGLTGQQDENGVWRRAIDGHPRALRRHCEDSLKRLGTDTIDLYYLHRRDQRVPIEESVGEMARLLQEGKVRALGLSEVGTGTLRRAHATHSIAALQSEYSLWSRNAELGTLQACRELGIAYVAFSPLGRAFLTGTLHAPENLPPGDMRRSMPRFAPPAWAQNRQLLAPMRSIAEKAGCTLAELAIAWLLHQGEHVIALPGTTSAAHMHENVRGASVALSAEVLAELDALFRPEAICGPRYAPEAQNSVDTERFAFEMQQTA